MMLTSSTNRTNFIEGSAPAPLPLRLETLCRLLLPHPHWLKALKLVHRFFPEQLGKVLAETDWLEIMSHFLRLVKQNDWFEIDWELLDDLVKQVADKQVRLENDFNLSVPELEGLATSLEYIPVKSYGFTIFCWIPPPPGLPGKQVGSGGIFLVVLLFCGSSEGQILLLLYPHKRPRRWYSRLGSIPVAATSRLVKLNIAATSAMSKMACSEKTS